ncbi:MAG: histidine phosphatase family protein [Rhodomicrobiaceae bacterium]
MRIGSFFRTIARTLGIVPLVLLLLAASGLPARALSEAELWAALREPDHFVIMRHALAPGTGDPSRFRVDDCSTQRNLSEAGRQQARRTGEAFRRNGIERAAVYSSQWCRCLETARLLGLGEVKELAALNSFFGERNKGPAQIRQLQEELRGIDLSRPVVLVTHQVNVTGFTGVYPGSGEMAVVRREPDGSFETVGTIDPRSTR